MAAKKSAKKPAKKPVKKATAAGAAKLVFPPLRPAPCSKTIEFFTDVTLGPGEFHDTGVAKNVDCYQWLHVWVRAKSPGSAPMDNIDVQLVFELPGKMGATGFANLELPPYPINMIPTAMRVSSGTGIYSTFLVRAPIVGPTVRVIVSNNGAQTYVFDVYGYATH